MADALARHDRLCGTTIASHRGSLIKTTGDGLHAVFGDPADATGAALALQRGIAAIAQDCGLALKMRCGLHVGSAQERDGDYFGAAVNRAARIMVAAHGGQVLLSQAAVDQARDRLPAGCDLVHLGRVRLRDLASPEDVWQLVHADLPRTFPALRSLDSTPNNLPQQLTSFVGRDGEVAAVKALFDRTRLITLTGSGGCGKTRLALHVAADLIDAYPDGVWLAELAALTDPALVPQAVGAALGLKEERGKTFVQTLTEHLKSRQLLLLLDNAEHLLHACAQLVDVVLRQCPRLVLLVSSREGLGIAGELTYRVPSLSTPDPKEDASPESMLRYESVRLFVDRSQSQLPQFALTSRNAAVVASICARLDGIPLAIELAAARVRSLSVEELNQRLDQRFRLLTGGSRTALPRQQTLRSTIDWSYDLLNANERALLCRLAVFAGGWSLEAAEQVCVGDGIDDALVLDLLVSLADKSLVLAEDRGGTTRYRLLETVRQYARDRLLEHGEGDRWRDRHLEYFVGFAEAAEAHLRGETQQAWFEKTETEHDNLRAALTWVSVPGGNVAAGLRIADALFQFWYVRGYFGEARAWYSTLLAAGTGVSASERAGAMGPAGVMAWQQGDYATARRFHEEALSILRAQDDRFGIARSLINLGTVDFDQGDYEAAKARFEEGLAIRRDGGSERGVAAVLHNLGAVAKARGDPEHAWAQFQESLALYRLAKDQWGIAISLSNLGGIACERGNLSVAQAMFVESLALRQELGDRRGIAESLDGLAVVASASHRHDRAARLWGAAERLREELGVPLSPYDRRDHAASVAAARAAMADDAAFEHGWQEGRAMTVPQAIAHALQPPA
jgi:predicted ATPase